MAEYDHRRHHEEHSCGGPAIMFKGLAVLFIFIGLAIFVSTVLWVFRSGSAVTAPNWGFGWIWNLIGLLFAIWVLSWIFRAVTHRHRCCCEGHGHGHCCCGEHCHCDEGGRCSCGCEDEEGKPARRRARK